MTNNRMSSKALKSFKLKNIEFLSTTEQGQTSIIIPCHRYLSMNYTTTTICYIKRSTLVLEKH